MQHLDLQCSSGCGVCRYSSCVLGASLGNVSVRVPSALKLIPALNSNCIVPRSVVVADAVPFDSVPCIAAFVAASAAILPDSPAARPASALAAVFELTPLIVPF